MSTYWRHHDAHPFNSPFGLAAPLWGYTYNEGFYGFELELLRLTYRHSLRSLFLELLLCDEAVSAACAPETANQPFTASKRDVLGLVNQFRIDNPEGETLVTLPVLPQTLNLDVSRVKHHCDCSDFHRSGYGAEFYSEYVIKIPDSSAVESRDSYTEIVEKVRRAVFGHNIPSGFTV